MEYLKTGVWQRQDNEFATKKSFWITRQLRVIIYTLKGISRHESFIRSAALTFYTVMSLVPIAALAFGIIKGLGLDEHLNEYLSDNYSQYNGPVGILINFAGGVLDRTRGGVVAFTGLVILIWAAVRVFVNVESAFNTIWEVKRKRSFAHKASAYASVIFVIPILWVGISAMVIYIRNILVKYTFFSTGILYTLGSLLAIWVIFILVYKAVPYTKVKWKYAMQAGALASVTFMLFQAIYIYIQSGVNAYNIIYGSFAALPLLLIWIQISWQIVLLGAELCFSFQNIDSYMQERDAEDISYDNKRKIMLASLLVIIRNFSEGKGGLTSEQIAKELKVPLRLTRDVMFELENSRILASAKSPDSDRVNIYIPAKDIHTLTFYGALKAVEETGSHIEGKSDSRELKKVSKILNQIKDMVSESGLDMPLVELIGHAGNDTGKRKGS